MLLLTVMITMFGILHTIYKYIRHGPFMLYWVFYDIFLTIYVTLTYEHYIGIYLKIMTHSEQKWLFENNIIGGGYSLTFFKIFFNEKFFSVESCIYLINHEVLHQVLFEVEGSKAKHCLDHIHKQRSNGFTDDNIPIWTIDFVENSKD